LKVTIQHLGAIQQAEIDLKPLTVLIGPNNAGKTWMAYTLGGIFGSRGWNEYVEAYVEEKLSEKYSPLDSAIETVLKDGHATIDLVAFAEQYGEQYFQNVARYAPEWMPDFMSTQFAVFDKLKVSIDLMGSKAAFVECVKQATVRSSVAGELFTLNKKRDDPVLHAYISDEKEDSTSQEEQETPTEKIPAEEIKLRLVRNVMRVLHQAIYVNTVMFPAERTGLVTARPSPHLSLSDNAQKVFESFTQALKQLADLEEFTFPGAKNAIAPVGDFLSTLDNIFNMDTKDVKRRERPGRPNLKLQKHIDFARILEQKILAGGIDFSTPEPDPQRDILFHPLKNVALEIPIASSMVKGLSSLVLYLRYLARPDELLIIDEPEMNLHPEAQVKMIEFLAMLANAGLNVLITTHSPYLLDHLSNLIYAAEHGKEEQQSLAEIFFLESCDAFISQEKVSIYCVDKGTAENILQDHGRIDWSTFGNITDQIADIHYKL
jgi:energy-coupling factor transporter ATP-binding protein EcfA2